MALRFYKNFTNLGGTSYRVELYGPAGDEREIYLMGPEPVQYNTLDAERDEHRVVRGSEVLFEFLIPRNNLSHYDDLFQSDYKDWELRFLIGTDLLFRGYVQPESISRTIIKQNANISLSATDALKDLSEIDFSDDGVPYAGKMTIMEVIKEALDKLGFELDFLIKLNIHETDNADNILCFLNTFIDAYRFAKIKSGKTEFDSCLEVLEEVLRPFHVTLRQSQDMYKIMAVDERDTYNYEIDWTNLTQNSRTEITDTVNITSYKVTPFPDLSYLPPIKHFEITHRNRNLGVSAVPYDENDFTLWTSTPAHSIVAGFMRLSLNQTTANGNSEINTEFSVSEVTSSDYLKVAFTCGFSGEMYDKFSSNGIKYVAFRVGVSLDNGVSYEFAEAQQMSQEYNNYETPNTDIFKITGTANYRVKIEYFTGGGTTYSANIGVGNMSIRRATVFEEDGAEVYDITFDSFQRITSDADAKIRAETETLFGDSLQIGDLGALYTGIDGVDNTEAWTRLGQADNMPILNLWGLRALNDRQRYTEYLQIDIRDYDHNLYPESVLQFTRDGTTRYYTFGSYARHMRRGIIVARIVEKVYADVDPDYYSTPLTSVDGEETSRSTLISTSGDVTSTERSNWNTAYSQTRQWDGGDTGLVASDGRTSLDVLESGTGAAQIRDNDGLDGRYGQLDASNTWLHRQIIAPAGNTNPVLALKQGASWMDTRHCTIEFLGASDYKKGKIVADREDIYRTGYPNTATSSLSFYTAYENTDYLRLRITDNGGVAIGKTTVTNGYLLDVNGKGIFQNDLIVSGNFGIGTTSPESSFQASGSKLNSPTAAGVHIGLDGNYGSIELAGSSGGYIDFTDGGGTDYLGRIRYDTGTERFRFYTNTALAMTITSAGNVEMENDLTVDGTLYANAIVAESFLASIDLALLSGHMVSKSVTQVSRDFIIPATAATGTLYVDALPGHPTSQAFEVNDWVRLQVVDRTGGGLVWSEVWGTVTNFTDIGGGEQTYTFTVQDDGGVATQTVFAGAAAQDVGQSGDGYILQDAGYGDHRPFMNVSTWVTDPSIAGNITDRVRIGNLNGLTGQSGFGSVTRKDATNFIAQYWNTDSDWGIKGVVDGSTFFHLGNVRTIAGINFDADALFTGSKHITDGFSTDGISIVNDGSFHTPNLYINSDGGMGFRGEEFIYAYLGVGDDPILENNDTVQYQYVHPNDIWVKLKTITLGSHIFHEGRTLRIKFNLFTNYIGQTVSALIYRDGTPVGTTRSTTEELPEPFEEDIADWKADEVIELWGKPAAVTNSVVYVDNLHVCGDLAVAVNEVTGTNWNA